MKKIKIFIFIILSNIVFADDNLFNSANNAYANQEYNIAIEIYDSIIKQDLESAELFYNLGNCYYKKKDWANAIWFYEKSLKINQQLETRQNLDLTKQKIIDKIESMPDIFYIKWWNNFVLIFNTYVWQLLSMFLIIISLIINACNYFSIFKFHSTFKVLLFSAIILFIVSQYSEYKIDNQKNAIVFSTIAINSAPSQESKTLFTLHSGTKVEILDNIGEWIKIKIINGNTGWVLKHNVKEI